jgi:hypothetical protein
MGLRGIFKTVDQNLTSKKLPLFHEVNYVTSKTKGRHLKEGSIEFTKSPP